MAGEAERLRCDSKWTSLVTADSSVSGYLSGKGMGFRARMS